MNLSTRKMFDHYFSALGLIAIAMMAAAVIVILAPILVRGAGAVVFRATVEHRRIMLEQFQKGNPERLTLELDQIQAARQPLYDIMQRFEKELAEMPARQRRELRDAYREVQTGLHRLLGPPPGSPVPVLIRLQYGASRWDRAQEELSHVLFEEYWDYSDASRMGVKRQRDRRETFQGTALVDLFDFLDTHIRDLLRPRWTFYGHFFTTRSMDAHFFGGIWPEILGTIYLTIGAMLFALPLGIIAAIYLTEYAREGMLVSFLRICISTLAGVPSIVFGLFGLAFFINTLGVSSGKSVLAGSLTLALLILPTIIRASEEAIRSVPHAYKEASMSLGASRWRTVVGVILPAALPGILTGVVISMGRAAGETAPIIFTAAVSMGRILRPAEALSNPTMALPWNIYNLATEHEAVDEIRHVQYGMVMTLVAIVLLLNVTAIVLRARVSKRLKG